MIGTARKKYSATVGGTKVEVADKQPDIRVIALHNTTAAVAYLQIFFKRSADVTVGTTAPDWSIGLPASGGISLPFSGGWAPPGAGLTIAGTTTRAGSTGANIDVNIAFN